MVKKLLSALHNRGLRLALKALLFFFPLLFVYGSGFHLFPIILFVGISAFFYFRPLEGSEKFFTSFLFILFFALLTSQGLFAFFLAILFYLLLGVKELFFLRREIAYYFVHTLLLLIGLTYFFSGSLHFVFIPLGIFLLYLEFFKTLAASTRFPAFSALFVAFVAFQFAWLFTILPFSSFAGSALLVSLLFIISELILYARTNNFGRTLVLWGVTTFTSILVLIVFLSDLLLETA